HVTFESCPKDTLILFHTHPKTNCLASQTDINTLSYRQETLSNKTIMLIMCEENRYALYS
ncbi:MAG: hypothetical protein ACQESC_02545, partial [Nanobdellota archaeon]